MGCSNSALNIVAVASIEQGSKESALVESGVSPITEHLKSMSVIVYLIGLYASAPFQYLPILV